MNDVDERFLEIRKRIRTPEYFRNALVKFVGQICHALNVRPNWLNPIFRDAVSRIRPAFGWRREILQRWRKTILKELLTERRQRFTPYVRLGHSCGCFTNITTAAFEELDDDDEFTAAVFAPFFELEEEVLENILNEAEKISALAERIKAEMYLLPIQQQKEFSSGYNKGIDALFDDQGNVTYRNTTTDIYHFLLMYGDALGELKSVREVFLFAKSVMGERLLPHSEEDFKQLCHRVGFRGASYLSTTRRKKSIDRAKHGVH